MVGGEGSGKEGKERRVMKDYRLNRDENEEEKEKEKENENEKRTSVDYPCLI